jgi:hypothetical protein
MNITLTGDVARLERAHAITFRDIAHNGMRLEHREIAVLDRRHEPVRIHRTIGIAVRAPELPADRHPLESNARLRQRPQHLLYID